MIHDYFTNEVVKDIKDNSGVIIGVDIITIRYLKMPNTKNLKASNTYSVTVKHRILLKGSGWQASGTYQSQGFNNYPVMICVNSGIQQISDPNAVISLKRIFPKTINANIEQSNNVSTGNSVSQSNQTSTGSSSSNVNTFGINVTGGWFGDGPVATISLDYSHTWENSQSQGASVGNASARDNQASSGAEMSVKDWSAYSTILNFDGSAPGYFGEYVQWNWGQTFPWNIFDYSESGAGPGVLLPDDVIARLLYTSGKSPDIKNILLPPSDLSLFGVDFTMAAEWHITFPEPLTSAETLQFQHNVIVTFASHSMVTAADGEGQLIATIGSQPGSNSYEQSSPVDIGQYALIPIIADQRNGTGISFQSNLFDIAPTLNGSFKIRSRSNDLMVTGQYFSPAMSASFQKGYSGKGATLTVAFKIADLRTQYALIFKHWIGTGSGTVILTCVINGNKTVINVTDPEGQGSYNNLSQMDLRNFNLKSANFHDYLVLGWNEVTITVLPQDSTVPSEYIISALAVEG